ncbi:MAG: hypothetical protein FJ271_17690 [Planctomycetes bacterium]|nr:hypothetical protein [Planctomycetota bacterium]
MTTKYQRVCVFLSLAIAGFAAQPVFAQSAGETDLAAWLRQVRPEIEKVLGQPLPAVPQCQPASAEQFRLARDADLNAHLLWRFPNLETRGRAVEDAQATANVAAIARLVEGTDVILVRPDNTKIIAGWNDSLRKAASAEFIKLAVVVETIRYHLDRRYDLSRLRTGCKDAEEWFALQALVEGRCQQVACQLAEQLGWSEYAPLLAARFRFVADVSTDPGLRMMTQSAWQQRYHAAIKGQAFFNHLVAHKLPDFEKQAFARPPRSLAAVERPEAYVSYIAGKKPDLAALLAGMEKQPPSGVWCASQQVLTPAILTQVAALVGMKDRAERVLASWQDGRTLVWSQTGDAGRHVAVSWLRFQTQAASRAYHELATDLQRKRDGQTGNFCGLSVRVVDSRFRPVTVPDAVEATLWDRKLQGPGGQPLPTSTLLARRGEDVIEITWFGIPADMAWADALLR